MNHFALGDWVDFVRGLKAPSDAALMQGHLDAGCLRCSKVVRMWQDLVVFGSRERLYSPPEWALRSLQGCYGLLKPGRHRARAATVGRLIFDSLLEPISVGVRSSQLSARQLVYSAGDVLIDLRLEPRLGRVYVVGQAQGRPATNVEMSGISVLALKGTQEIGQTKCNQFGEFQFDLETGEGFSIAIKGPKLIVIPLPGLRLLRSGDSKL